MPFSFDILKEMAREAAKTPYKKPDGVVSEILEQIDYDAYQQIRYKADKTLKLDRNGRTPAQLFHLGKYFKEPVRMSLVEDGIARELKYSADLFDMPVNHVARTLPEGLGFAGFRIMAPDLKRDWYAALGASYFRTSGPYDQYGLSARGLAITLECPCWRSFRAFPPIGSKGPSATGPRSPSGVCSTARAAPAPTG